MLKDVFNGLIELDAKIEGVLEMDAVALKKDLIELLDNLPCCEEILELRKVLEQIAKRPKKRLVVAGDNSPPPDKLDERRVQLQESIAKNEEVRVAKKLVEFMMERAVDHVVRTQRGEHDKLNLLDVCAKEAIGKYSVVAGPEVEGVNLQMVGTSKPGLLT